MDPHQSVSGQCVICQCGTFVYLLQPDGILIYILVLSIYQSKSFQVREVMSTFGSSTLMHQLDHIILMIDGRLRTVQCYYKSIVYRGSSHRRTPDTHAATRHARAARTYRARTPHKRTADAARANSEHERTQNGGPPRTSKG